MRSIKMVAWVLWILPVGSVNAALVKVTGNIDAAYDNTTAFNEEPWDGQQVVPGWVYEMPLYFELDSIQPDSFGAIAVSITARGSITVDSYYFPSGQVFTSGKSIVAYYESDHASFINSTETSVSATIAQGVTSPDDPRIAMGKSGPFLIGYAFIDMGGAGGTATITPTDFLVNHNGDILPSNQSTMYGERIDFSMNGITYSPFEVPEPAGAGVLGLGVVGLLRRRRNLCD